MSWNKQGVYQIINGCIFKEIQNNLIVEMRYSNFDGLTLSLFFWMVKLGPTLLESFIAWSIAWRFFSASSSRCLFSSMSRCFFSSTSRTLLSSSSFFFWARRFSSSARDTYNIANSRLSIIWITKFCNYHIVHVNEPHLALSLLLLEAFELIFLLGPLFAPFVDVFLQLIVQVRPLLVLTLFTKIILAIWWNPETKSRAMGNLVDRYKIRFR